MIAVMASGISPVLEADAATIRYSGEGVIFTDNDTRLDGTVFDDGKSVDFVIGVDTSTPISLPVDGIYENAASLEIVFDDTELLSSPIGAAVITNGISPAQLDAIKFGFLNENISGFTPFNGINTIQIQFASIAPIDTFDDQSLNNVGLLESGFDHRLTIFFNQFNPDLSLILVTIDPTSIEVSQIDDPTNPIPAPAAAWAGLTGFLLMASLGWARRRGRSYSNQPGLST